MMNSTMKVLIQKIKRMDIGTKAAVGCMLLYLFLYVVVGITETIAVWLFY